MSPSLWLLILTVLPGQSYSPLQLEYLDARKPWIVDESTGMEVLLKAEPPSYGYRLIFIKRITVDGETVKIPEDIFAVPREKDVYWLREDELATFEGLAPGIVFDTADNDRIGACYALLLVVLAVWAFRICRRAYAS